MKELISVIIAAILSGTAGAGHFSCDVRGCTIEGAHSHSGGCHNSGNGGHHSGHSRGHH